MRSAKVSGNGPLLVYYRRTSFGGTTEICIGLISYRGTKKLFINSTAVQKDKFVLHEGQIIRVVENTDFYLLLEKSRKLLYHSLNVNLVFKLKEIILHSNNVNTSYLHRLFCRLQDKWKLFFWFRMVMTLYYQDMEAPNIWSTEPDSYCGKEDLVHG